jgi:predicted RNA polymerase sigma factor
MKLSQGDNPGNHYCAGCRAWMCRCGRRSKEDRERIKAMKEKRELEESERKDRQKEVRQSRAKLFFTCPNY